MALRKIAPTASAKKVGLKGVLGSEDWNSAFSEMLSVLSSLETEWNTNLQPLLDSLPNGKRKIALSEQSSILDPVANGFDGAQMYMDNVASSSRDEGLFWHSTLSRPRSIKESVLEVRRDLLQIVGNLEAKVLLVDENSGLTDAQKSRIGMNIFDASQPNAANSNEGRSKANQLWIQQLAADVYNLADGVGSVLDGNDYTFGGATGKQTKASSIVDRLAALEGAGGAAHALDAAYTGGQTANVDLATAFTINKSNANAPDTVLVTNALNDNTTGLRISRTNAGATGWALHVDNGQSQFDDTLNMTISSSAATKRGIDVAQTITGANAGDRAAVRASLVDSGTATGRRSGHSVSVDSTFTNDSADLVGFHADFTPDSSSDAKLVELLYSSAGLGGEPTEVNGIEIVQTHSNANFSPGVWRGLHIEPSCTAGSDVFAAWYGTNIEWNGNLDGATGATLIAGHRFIVDSGSTGSANALQGAHVSIDTTNMTAGIVKGYVANMTGDCDAGFDAVIQGASGQDRIGAKVSGAFNQAGDDFVAFSASPTPAQQAGGPANVTLFKGQITDGDHLADPDNFKIFEALYTQSDASHKPTNVYGYTATLDLSNAPSAPTISKGLHLDLVDFKQGIHVKMDASGSIPAGQVWNMLHLEAAAMGTTDDTSKLRGAYLNLDPSNIADTDRIIGLEINMPTGMRQGVIFTQDNEQDIGADGVNRPRKVFIGTEVKVGNSILIATNSITGSGATTLTTTSGNLILDASGDVAVNADLDLSNAARIIKLLDNNAAALSIREAGNNYLVFDTSDGSEKVVAHKHLHSNDATIDMGSTSARWGTLYSSSVNTSGSAVIGSDTTMGAGTKCDGKKVRASSEIQTTDATATMIKSITLDNSNTYHIKAVVVAYRSDVEDERASYHIEGTFFRPASGNAAQVGATTSVHTAESAGATSWDVNFVINGGAVEVQVTGSASPAHTIQWGCSAETVNVGIA